MYYNFVSAYHKFCYDIHSNFQHATVLAGSDVRGNTTSAGLISEEKSRTQRQVFGWTTEMQGQVALLLRGIGTGFKDQEWSAAGR